MIDNVTVQHTFGRIFAQTIHEDRGICCAEDTGGCPTHGEPRVSETHSGEAGHRSQCLSHAKRALYHLSYIPLVITLFGLVNSVLPMATNLMAVWARTYRSRHDVIVKQDDGGHMGSGHPRLFQNADLEADPSHTHPPSLPPSSQVHAPIGTSFLSNVMPQRHRSTLRRETRFFGNETQGVSHPKRKSYHQTKQPLQ